MFGPLKFTLAKLFGHEPTFQRYSVTDAEILKDLAGKHVAIVGNSRGLSKTEFGAAIDTADIVIRINRAPMPDQLSHGKKTSWLALATALTVDDQNRVAPERIIWMSHKRKRLARRIAQSDGFFLYPLIDKSRLGDKLKSPPSTGAMVIDLVVRSQVASVDIYGFDFFASQSLSGRRKASQVPHDFSAEKDFVLALAGADNRISIH